MKLATCIAAAGVAFAAAIASPHAAAAPGQLDPTFGTGGIVRTNMGTNLDSGNALAIDASGRLVVAGYGYNGANNDFAVVRFNADGTLDTTFNGTGIVTTAIGASVDMAVAVAIDASGRIVAAGSSHNGTKREFALVRYNADGSLDTSFNGTGKVTTSIGTGDDAIFAMTIDASGRIVAAGYSNNILTYSIALARYNANGTLDTTLNGTGKVVTAIGGTDDIPHAIAIDASGRIVVAGHAFTGANYDFALVRYNANGSLDTSFNGTGKVTTPIGASNDVGYAVAFDPNGRIVVAGSTFGANSDFALARYNVNGTLDTTFNGTGKVITPMGDGNDLAYAIAIDSNGRIVAAGPGTSGSAGFFAAARYLDNGALDTSFAGTGKRLFSTGPVNAGATALALDALGRLVLAGSGGTGSTDFAVARLLPGGSLDVSFGVGGVATANVSPTGNGQWTAVARQADGKIVAAGSVSNGLKFDFGIARYNADGTLDTTFNGNGKVITAIGPGDSVPQALAIDGNGRIVVAGYSSNGANDDFAVACYLANGALDTAFNGTGIVTTAIGTSIDQAYALALDASGRIVAAGLSYNGGKNDFAWVRYNANGTLDTSFNATGKVTLPIGTGDDAARALAIDASGRIVAAGSSYNGSNNDFALVRLNPNGSPDSTLGGLGIVATQIGTGSDDIFALAIDASGRMVVAGSTFNGANTDFALARYDSNGALDTTFNGTGKVVTAIGTGSDTIRALVIDASGRIVVAGDSFTGANVDYALARYNANGTLDSTFNGTGIVTTPIGSAFDTAKALVLQPDGKAVLAGNSADQPTWGLARYLMEQSPAAFAFTPQAGVALSTPVNSNTITVSGVTGLVPISVVDGQYAVGCADPWFNSTGIVINNSQVCVRHVSSSQPGSTVATTLIVGTTSATFTSTTGKAGSTSLVASSANPSSVESPVTFTATVSGSFGPATGLVTFKDGTIVLGAASVNGAGQASLTTSSLVIGSHAITANYGGDATYNASVSSGITQVVNGNAISAAVGTSNASITYGTSVTFTATLTPAPGGGVVFFYDGGNFIGADTVTGTTATFVTRALGVGSHTITAEFAGSGLYGAVTSPGITQTVTPASSATLVGSNAAPGNLGSPVTFTAAVSGPGFEFGGTLAFKDGAATIAGCSAVPVVNQAAACSTAMLAAGSHSITAVYSGDGNNLGSISNTLPQDVTYDPAADADSDSIPNGVEFSEGRDPLLKDNDVFANARLFAMQQYRDFLGREGDAGGITYYTDILTNQPASRAAVIENFFNSPEFGGTVAPVTRLYFAFFDRIPDYPGLQYQVNAYRTGTPLTVIANNFSLSPEFQATYGSLTDSQYVVLLYQNVLGRTPVQAEIDYHVARLVSGVTRGEVMVGFSESPEYQALVFNAVYVTNMYVGMLRRAPEQAGFDYWVAYMAGGNPGQALIMGFLNAPEYYNRFLP